MKTVQRISKAKFKIFTPNVPNSELLLDFNPVINEFKLLGNFYLIHWQARPKGHREWGIYHSATDTYRSNVSFPSCFGKVEFAMLEDPAPTIPSAVLVFTGKMIDERGVFI